MKSCDLLKQFDCACLITIGALIIIHRDYICAQLRDPDKIIRNFRKTKKDENWRQFTHVQMKVTRGYKSRHI